MCSPGLQENHYHEYSYVLSQGRFGITQFDDHAILGRHVLRRTSRSQTFVGQALLEHGRTWSETGAPCFASGVRLPGVGWYHTSSEGPNVDVYKRRPCRLPATPDNPPSTIPHPTPPQ